MSDAPPPQNEPHVVNESAGTHAWCSCALSKNQPYCDGSHAGTEHRPMVVKLEEGAEVAWCGCKKTKTPPYCDGSHAAG